MAARGPGPGRLRAAAGGGVARGFRERGAQAKEPVAPACARARRCPPRPGRGGLGGASSLLGERGGGRAAKPGPEPARTGSGRRGGRERSQRSPGGPEGARRAAQAVSPGSRTWLGPRCEARAKSPSGLGGTASRPGTARLQLPGARRSITDLNRFWKSHIFQAFVKQSLLLF